MSELFQERFEKPELIGEGGMGNVFRVDDPRLGRSIAVKVLHSDRSEETTYKQRFQKEARTIGGLEHPSIPPVYEYGETDQGLPYFALKLLEGENLASLIDNLREKDPDTHKRWPFPERVIAALRLCEALEYAHSKQLLHRDIKPENVMLGPFGEVWLVDWGVAGPPSEPTAEEQEAFEKRLTEEPTFMGTLHYAAPEQLAGTYTEASDQYSLGATLYEFFCLEPAHPGKNRMEVLTAVLNDLPKDAEFHPQPIQGRVPREVSVLLKRMLQKKPEDRFPSMSEVKDEFRLISGGDIRPICPHTLTKKALFRFGRHLDNYGYWLMPLLLLWLLYPLYALINLALSKI